MSRPKQSERRELWRQRIAQQENSGQTVRVFCREHKLSEQSFNWWRQLGPSSESPSDSPWWKRRQRGKRIGQAKLSLNCFLTGGERLHIPADAATLRLVLSALRQQK